MSSIIEATTFSADILIVDDKIENIRFLSDFLLAQNYRVRKAISGQAALTAVKTLPPDLILLDINMPNMNGFEVCQQLKEMEATRPIPVIFLSAGDDLADKVRGFQVGGVDYITKPFHLEEVLVRVQTQLTIRQLQLTLEEKNVKLKQALEILKSNQVALVQKERIATLRKVVAGVAHEINNPLSFIACNIEPIREYKNYLLELILLYQKKYSTGDPEIENLIQDIDLEFLASDFDNIINSMKSGSERINSVVLALRIFTRLDEVGFKEIDVHQCINTTLALLKHRLSIAGLDNNNNDKIIEVQKDYGDLPLVSCYGEQLNQVIFNLLCNAIDAIEVKLAQTISFDYYPKIYICTNITYDHQLLITIKDNGIGITEENQARLFEPFFTTKPAGYGIGLGLAISQRIIEETHSGRLSCRSVFNEGTEFTIQIPV